MQNTLTGKRVPVTQASEFMGPGDGEVFALQGADVVQSNEPLAAAGAPEAVVASAGPIDVLGGQSLHSCAQHTRTRCGTTSGEPLPWRRRIRCPG